MNITEKFVRKSIKVLSFNAFSFRKVYNFPTGKMIVSAEQTFSIYSCTIHICSVANLRRKSEQLWLNNITIVHKQEPF